MPKVNLGHTFGAPQNLRPNRKNDSSMLRGIGPVVPPPRVTLTSRPAIVLRAVHPPRSSLDFAQRIGEFVLDGTAREVCAYLSMWGHMQSFAKGVVDTRYLVFDLAVAVLAVGLSIGGLQARRHGLAANLPTATSSRPRPSRGGCEVVKRFEVCEEGGERGGW